MTIKASELSGQDAWDAVRRERDMLAAQVEVMREALATIEGWIIIPERNCSCHISPPCSNCVDKGNAEYDDEQVKAALKLPDLHSDILKKRDARVLRDAANEIGSNPYCRCHAQIIDLADDMEKSNGN